MSAFIGLAGLFGFAVCLVVFIISLVRKRPKKPGAVGMAVCLVLFVVGLAMYQPGTDPPAGENDSAPAVAESAADEEGTAASSSEPGEQVSAPEGEQSAEGTASPPEPTEGTPSEASEPVLALGDELIPGLKAADIKLNLKKWGLKDVSPKNAEGSDGVSYSTSAVDSETGAELSYFIMADGVLNVKYATFSLLNLAAISEEDFQGVAAGYLGYCATVPFDGAEPEKCKQWVADNIAKCNEAGKVETLKVGNVEFSLYGTGNGARYLDIKAVKE